jgi:hypothetical protein
MPKETPPTTAPADFSEDEIARRRDATVKRMIATPPKTQKGELKRPPAKKKRKSKQPA